VDLLILVILCCFLHKKVRAKGRKSTGYVFLLIGMWIGGAISGFILALLILMVTGETGETAELLFPIGFALGGAAIAAIVPFLIVQNLPHVADEFAWRDRAYGPDGRDRDEDYRNLYGFSGSKRDNEDHECFFGQGNSQGHNSANDSSDPPRLEDDRYKSE
jgi:hypothetical protein